VPLGKESSTNNTSTTTSLPSTFCRALGKVFAECHSVLGKEKPPSRRLISETAPLSSVLGDTRQRDYLFAECPPAYTRQRGHQRGPLSVSLPSALGGTQQSLLLCRVPWSQHSAKKLYRCPSFSVECYDTDTRQRTSLLSVTLGKVTSTYIFNLFFLFHPNKQKISHIHHRYHIIIIDITYTLHISQTP
jgi:hypothetical protein